MITEIHRFVRAVLLTAVALGLLIAPVTSRAANPYLEQAIQSYENFEYEEALRVLQQALEVPDTSKEDLAKIHLYMGLVRFTLGDPAQAEKDFKKALGLNYKIKPPADTSPKIVSEFQLVKKSVPPPEDQPPPGGDIKPPGGGGTVIVKPLPPPPRKRVWTWVVLGVGAGALVGGGVFGYLASSAKADFDKEPWADDANDLKNTAESHALLANILFGVGGAGMAAALILFFTEGADQPAEPQAGLSITPTPLGFEATYRF